MRFKPRAVSGFTLLEILIVLAVVALLAGLVVNNLDNILAAAETVPPEVHFREVVAEARLRAIESGEVQILTYDSERGQFVLRAEGQSVDFNDETSLVRDRHDGHHDDDQGNGDEEDWGEGLAMQRYEDLDVSFFRLLPVETVRDLNDDADFSEEPIEVLRFAPSGAGTAANVVLRYGRDRPVDLTLDAFSAGPLPRVRDGY